MLKRRDFLRATLITAGVAILPGCGEDTEPNPDTGRVLTDGTASFPQGLASGDPKSDTVILWARVEDSAKESDDIELELEMATDKDFTRLLALDTTARKVPALAKFDHCAKIRVAGLAPATTYYYRFIYVKGDKNLVSPVGRTKTAPAADADVAVKFAFVSCQDYIGRFYNSYVALAKEDVDFIVHLGDYVYETTGDPSFQETAGRTIKFTDEAGALPLGEGDKKFFAAKSLSNYRELYKAYRSDKNLQAVHLLFPMINIWDDHEFSNDCYGAVATYFNGKKDERDEARRKAANQAWFEYQPVDYNDAPDFTYDPSVAYPNDIKIYRDFVFGKHVHLVMTDLRTYRADHLIPEDAFPGEVVLDQAALTAALGAVPPNATPYLDVDTFMGGIYKTALTAVAMAAGFDAAKVKGNISAAFINQIATQVNPQLPPAMQILLIDPTTQAMLDKGISYADIGKLAFYNAIGSRYFVVKSTFDLYGKIKYQGTAGASEDVMGKEQEDWFLRTIQDSKATWKVWGSEYTLDQIAIDLSAQTVPDAFKRSFHLNVDDWNGSRNKRSELIGKLAPVGGVVAVTGDIHACYAGTPAVDMDKKGNQPKIVEFVGAGISSSTFKGELKSQLATDPVLSKVPGADLLVDNLDNLLRATDPPINPFLGFAESGSNGYSVATVNGEEFAVTMRLIPGSRINQDYTGKAQELEVFIKTVKLKTVKGGSDLYQEIDGVWKKWDAETLKYV
jgi:alkaline phosphatase D